MSVCVQPVELPGGDRTWTVLGEDHRQVGPVEEFLEYHRVTGSSPHTVRAYAKALLLWWRYLELDGRDWGEVDVPAARLHHPGTVRGQRGADGGQPADRFVARSAAGWLGAAVWAAAVRSL